MKIWIVDAFTDQPFKGNPAAVTVVKDFPEDQKCQKIAMEMNLSETVFLKELEPNRFHIRWFTPTVEVKLCGHATLAAAHILNQQKLIKGTEVSFESISGRLKVSCSSTSNYTLDFPLQKTGESRMSSQIQQLFTNVINVVQAYDDILVEVGSEEQVRTFQPQINELEKIDCRGIILTSKGSTPYDFISRFFCPRIGINEDPVTGATHCTLAYYWQQRLNKSDFLAYQASSRGGEIKVSIVGDRVHLTGKAVTILEGVLQT